MLLKNALDESLHVVDAAEVFASAHRLLHEYAHSSFKLLKFCVGRHDSPRHSTKLYCFDME